MPRKSKAQLKREAELQRRARIAAEAYPRQVEPVMVLRPGEPLPRYEAHTDPSTYPTHPYWNTTAERTV